MASKVMNALAQATAWAVCAAVAGAALAAGPDPRNPQDNRTFVQDAAKQPGAQKLPSGLVFFSLEPGDGKQPTAGSIVTVHYRGTLIDGAEFDSSFNRNAPAEFPVKRVIPCWTEALQMMKVGGKAKIVCPSKIAYGASGAGDAIPPNATLVFEIQLLDSK
jgi:FKBP-type peptidyl-prolyl cis-trans isomerase FkpA